MNEIRKINRLKNITDFKEVEEILQKKLDNYPQINSREEFPDKWLFKDMKKGIDFIVEAISNNKKIVCITDCDADGQNTYYLFYQYFRDVLKYENVELVLAQRSDGYGPLPKHVMEHPADLYITSDHGITAKEFVEFALRSNPNTKVFITDHHEVDNENWPLWQTNKPQDEERVAIVDPMQKDCPFPDKNISGTVVLFFMLQALTETYKINIDIYEKFLDSIAFTTISDVMKVNQGLSRFFIKDFFNEKILKMDKQYLKVFLEECDLNEETPPTAEDIAFKLAPVCNACNRLTTAADAVNFLIQDDKNNSLEWWNYINGINNLRKEKQQKLLDYVEYRFKDYFPNKQNNFKFILVPGQFNKEAQGLLGIVAGRLSDKYKVPCIVLNLNEEKTRFSGSGRSVGTVDILSVFKQKKFEKFIGHLGGHKQALGIGVHASKINEFYKLALEEFAKLPQEQFMTQKKAIGFIDIKNISEDLIHSIKKFEPFGHWFQKPVFVTQAKVKKATEIGKQKNHLSMTVTDEKEMISFKALWFFHETTPKEGESVYLYFYPEFETFRGTTKISLKVSRIVPII